MLLSLSLKLSLSSNILFVLLPTLEIVQQPF
nr:MAG TPA: hypothetical protein [Bacteriophage sp.]DAI57880.1 MAG TPA: hypothetical protein [Caudoviricetes sp.]DAQ87691.1 MAG TPA: hypothetical protein [Caudoviricetes sp.]